jgi:hypothetical protein
MSIKGNNTVPHVNLPMIWAKLYMIVSAPVARRNSWVAASGRGVTYVNVTKDACSPQHWPVQVDCGRLAFARHRPGMLVWNILMIVCYHFD